MIALGIGLAALAAFVLSFVFYAVAPAYPPATDSSEAAADRVGPAQVIVEVLRNLATAALVAGLLIAAGWSGIGAGVLLGLALFTLPVVLLTGSVVHEGVPVRTAATHLLDWLIKLAAIGAIAGTFA